MERFCVVVSLRGSVAAKVRRVQRSLSLKTASHACVDFWQPHLTVGSGINVAEKKLSTLTTQFHSALNNITPFSVRIQGYEFMDRWSGGVFGRSPYVVYLRVTRTPVLFTLVTAVHKVTNRYSLFYRQPWPYTPHVTLAFSDLTKAGFHQAKAFLKGKKFTGTLRVDHVALLRKNSRGRWTEYKKFMLSTR